MPLMRLMLYSCREVSGLVSLSFDKNLSLFQKMRLSMHLSMCKLCKRHSNQLHFLQNHIKEHKEQLGSLTLPVKTKKKITTITEMNPRSNPPAIKALKAKIAAKTATMRHIVRSLADLLQKDVLLV